MMRDVVFVRSFGLAVVISFFCFCTVTSVRQIVQLRQLRRYLLLLLSISIFS